MELTDRCHRPAIDPVVMAAATVMRLQTIVPGEALITLNVRTYDESVRKHVLDAIERIAKAEAAASAAPKPPGITTIDHYDLVKNDPEATRRVADAFRQYFPRDRVQETGPTTASEDLGSFGAEWHVPAVFWFIGGTDPELYAKAKAAGR